MGSSCHWFAFIVVLFGIVVCFGSTSFVFERVAEPHAQPRISFSRLHRVIDSLFTNPQGIPDYEIGERAMRPLQPPPAGLSPTPPVPVDLSSPPE